MFPNIPLNLLSNTTQRILTQSNNIAYGTRGVVRVNEVQPNRKLDYFFRDFYMVLATAYLGELGFRGVDKLYNIPHMTKALQLNRLSELYPGALNYKSMPDVVRAHMMGSLVKSSSNYAVPKVLWDLEHEAGEKLKPEERKQLQILFNHLHKNMNFPEWLSENMVKAGEIDAKDTKTVLDEVRRLLAITRDGAKEMPGELKAALDIPASKKVSALGQITGPIKKALNFHKEAPVPITAEQRAEALTEVLAKWKDAFSIAEPEVKKHYDEIAKELAGVAAKDLAERKPALEAALTKVSELFAKTSGKQEHYLERLVKTELKDHAAKDKLVGFIKQGLESDAVLGTIKKIQRSGTWPKMFSSVIINFIFYGMMANFFDVKVLQPWQKKYAETHGGSSADLVKPGYKALIPALGILVVGLQNRIPTPFRKLGYFSRFAVVGGLALGTYTALAVSWMAKIAKSSPKTDAKAAAPQAQPQGLPSQAPVARPQPQPLPAQPAMPSFPATPSWQVPPPNAFRQAMPGQPQ